MYTCIWIDINWEAKQKIEVKEDKCQSIHQNKCQMDERISCLKIIYLKWKKYSWISDLWIGKVFLEFQIKFFAWIQEFYNVRNHTINKKLKEILWHSIYMACPEKVQPLLI